MPDIKISQSFMKAYVDYANKQSCGAFFKARYIDKDEEATTPTSDAMKLGIYFEYLCTGALPRDGVVPEMEYAYKGQARERVSAPYLRAQQSAELFHAIIKNYDIKIKEVGLKLSTTDMNGVVDIYADWAGKPVFIDLKYTGLIDDKWNESGWEINSLSLKDSLMVQGVHYKILAQECLGIENIPFYFFVFSQTDPKNIKIIEENVDESRLAGHKSSVQVLLSKLPYERYEPLPTVFRCFQCPLNHKCPHAVDYPLIERVDY